jgi:hypothetical protein
MANNKAVTNKVMDFGRVLLPLGRRVVEEFSKASMFFLPIYQLKRQPALFTANHETAFSAEPSQPARNRSRDLSPEEWRFSLVPSALPAAAPVRRCSRNNANIALRKKIIQGMEPGEMLPLALAIDERKPEGR